MLELKIPSFMQDMGEKFFAFILNLPEEKINLSTGIIQVNEIQQKILKEFYEFCIANRKDNIDSSSKFLDLGLDSSIDRFTDDKNLHYFNVWRGQAGGSFFIPQNIKDPFEAELVKIALEAYPLFLRNPLNAIYNITKSSFISNICIDSKFKYKTNIVSLFTTDNIISELIIGDVTKPEECRITCYDLGSASGSRSMPLSFLPDYLITNAYDLMFMRGVVSENILVKTLLEIISYFRKICTGVEQIELPIFIGFNNAIIASESSFESDIGIIRPYTKDNLKYLELNLQNKNNLNGFILETKYSFKIDCSTCKDYQEEGKKMSRWLDEIEDKVRFAATASIEINDRVGVIPIWYKKVHIFKYNDGFHYMVHKTMTNASNTYQLKSDEIDRFKKYISELQKLSTNQYNQLSVAIRRVNSALCERINPIDGFIDAIVGWESLFGEKGELIFRISLAISKLLKDKDDRKKYQTELKKYYDYRSTVLHKGALSEKQYKTLTSENSSVDHLCKNCTDILIKLIQVILFEHTELIDDEYRSTTIALLYP